jgi:hypothetical protein
MVFAIVFDYDLSAIARIGFGELPSRLPTGLISRIVNVDFTEDHRYTLLTGTYPVFRDIYDVTLYINKAKRVLGTTNQSDESWKNVVVIKERM